MTNDENDPSDLPWRQAGELARAWVPEDDSSAENHALTIAAAKLLQAIIFDEALIDATHDDRLRRYVQILQRAAERPGVLAQKLVASPDARVAQVGRHLLNAQFGWVKSENPRNVVVMTALLNMPRAS